MIAADDFFAEAARAGYDFYTGVPCSFLTPLINGALSSPALAYVGAASEGEAVAIAAGEAAGRLETADLPLLLTRLAAKRPVLVVYFAGHWLDVDTLGDLAEARNFG